MQKLSYGILYDSFLIAAMGLGGVGCNKVTLFAPMSEAVRFTTLYAS
jgi:hypothetical protein